MTSQHIIRHIEFDVLKNAAENAVVEKSDEEIHLSILEMLTEQVVLPTLSSKSQKRTRSESLERTSGGQKKKKRKHKHDKKGRSTETSQKRKVSNCSDSIVALYTKYIPVTVFRQEPVFTSQHDEFLSTQN